MFTIVNQDDKNVELTCVENQEHLERFPFRDKHSFNWGDRTKPAKLLVVPKIGGNLTVVNQNEKKVEHTCVENQEHPERFPLRDKQLFTWGDTTKPAKLLV
jgi:hypothetical protein